MSPKTNSDIRILLADSDDGLRTAAWRALERLGFAVDVASDGAEALALHTTGRQAVVVAAVLMPRRDGLEVLREIRSTSPETQVILLAEQRAIGSAHLGLRDGAFAYLVKPIEDLSQLTHLVERAVELQQLRRAATASGFAREAVPVIAAVPPAPAAAASPAPAPAAHTIAIPPAEPPSTIAPSAMTAAPATVPSPAATVAPTSPAAPPAPTKAAPPSNPPSPASPPSPATPSAANAAPPMPSLIGVTDLLRAGHQPTEVIPSLLESSAALFAAPHAALLASRAHVGLQLDCAYGYADASTAALDFVRFVGDAFAWRVVTERKTLQDSEASHRCIGTPVIARDQLLGVLVVYPIQEPVADPGRVAFFESLAAATAIAMEMARLTEENERLSPIDPLTLALKRAAFLDLSDREFRRSWRFDQPLSVIVLDVDGMHGLNSQFGRAFGDEVLRHVASACRGTIRAFDVIARYDQDAFAILLIMANPAGARVAAERLRMAVGAIDLKNATGPIQVTASLGVCSYPREGCASVFDMLDVAQTSQKNARRKGANQMSIA